MKAQKLNKQVSPFAGVSFVNYYFDKISFSQLIDFELGMRRKNSEYSDIIRNLTNVFFSRGDYHIKNTQKIIQFISTTFYVQIGIKYRLSSFSKMKFL